MLVLRRVTAIAALSLWVGGLTFYGAIVVPVGANVLGSAAAQGLVTQAVTTWLNALGAVALAVLAWNAACARRRWLWLTWAAMLAAQAALFALHPYLDQLLDGRAIVDRDAFYARHRVYLLVTSAQWLAAVAHLVVAIRAWRDDDRA